MDITQNWMNRRETVKISGGEVVLRPYDITALLDEGGNVLNPLLGKVKTLIEGGEKPMQAISKGFLSQFEQLPEMRKMLNGVLKKVILEPDMSQFDVDNFTLFEKIEIFTHLIGGAEGVKQAEKFHWEQSPVMATVPPVPDVQ